MAEELASVADETQRLHVDGVGEVEAVTTTLIGQAFSCVR